jgi:hypothetical protein
VKVIAIDPGGTTGWATFEVEALRSTGEVHWRGKTVAKCFDDGGQLNQPNHHALLWELLVSQGADYVICERFEHRNNDFTELISLEYIGVVKAYAQRFRVNLIMQGAHQAFNFNDRGMKLDRLGLTLTPYKKWKDANAARKHLVYYLCTQMDYPEIRQLALVAVTA